MSAVLEPLPQRDQRAISISEGMKGNKNATKGAKWRNSIEWALRKYESNDGECTNALLKTVKRGQALRAMALRTVSDAIAGKEYAIREISERLDGKVGAGQGDGAVRVLVIRGEPKLEQVEAITVESKRLVEHE